jgi:hypothetical protein
MGFFSDTTRHTDLNTDVLRITFGVPLPFLERATTLEAPRLNGYRTQKRSAVWMTSRMRSWQVETGSIQDNKMRTERCTEHLPAVTRAAYAPRPPAVRCR